MDLWWVWGHVQKENQLQPNVYGSCFHDLFSRTSRVRGLTPSPGAPLHCFIIPAATKQAPTCHLNLSACDLQTTCPNTAKGTLCILYVCSAYLNIEHLYLWENIQQEQQQFCSLIQVRVSNHRCVPASTVRSWAERDSTQSCGGY